MQYPKKSVNFRQVDSEICWRTDRETDRQSDTLITILGHPVGQISNKWGEHLRTAYVRQTDRIINRDNNIKSKQIYLLIKKTNKMQQKSNRLAFGEAEKLCSYNCPVFLHQQLLRPYIRAHFLHPLYTARIYGWCVPGARRPIYGP